MSISISARTFAESIDHSCNWIDMSDDFSNTNNKTSERHDKLLTDVEKYNMSTNLRIQFKSIKSLLPRNQFLKK